MTNAQIIMEQQILLAADGILREDEDGEIQPIQTYQAGKKLGYQVKKGEKAVAKFAVWKYMTSKKKEEEAETEADANEDEKPKRKGRMYLKVSAFFTDDQVEKIQK